MTEIRDHLFARRFATGVPVGVVSVLLVTYGVGVVALFASGRVAIFQAGLFLGAPLVVAVALLRPEWMILLLVALPPSLSSVPPMQMVAIMLVTLFGFLLQGGLRLGLKTGIYPLVGIIALAMLMRADTSGPATVAADTMLKFLVYYSLLMLVAFHAVAYERIGIDAVVNALVLGIVCTAILQPFVDNVSSFQSISRISRHPYGGPFANLAVIGFGVTYIRFSLSRWAGGRPRALDPLLMFVFVCVTAFGYNRAAWIAGLAIFALVSKWTGKKSFWIVTSLLAALALTVPVVEEAVFAGGSIDLSDPDELVQLTSGRSVLWGYLWERGAEAVPFGNGWGYVWSLTSVGIFGVEGVFTTQENAFIYPHNDFLYLFVELGFIGLGLLVAYWLLLVRKIRLLSRSPNESARYGAKVLIPVVLIMFFLQLFANGLSVRFVAERFFIAAGLLFGLHYVAQQSELRTFASTSGLRSPRGAERG